MIKTRKRLKLTHKFDEEIKTSQKSDPQTKEISIDSILFHYLSKELALSPFYEASFRRHQSTNKICCSLKPTTTNLIDHKWNSRIYEMVREKAELDHALSWLSTLGGAFSALGDYFDNCAEIAGKISINQLKLAFRLGDPTIAARCRLYFSLSLIQKKQYTLASRIVRNEYNTALNENIVDAKLVRMCQGIWSKLIYEWEMHRKCRQKRAKKLTVK